MSDSDSLYGFDIPHDEGEPCRDLIAIQIPYPPSKVRSVWIPDVSRALGSHGVQAGVIRQMGPLAFLHKKFGEEHCQRAEIGDWVLIRWGAGTMFQGGRGLLNAVGGWRYVSTFQDIIKVIPAAAMAKVLPPDLEWTDEGVVDGIDFPSAIGKAPAPDFNFNAKRA
jgi:hypothetical protein